MASSHIRGHDADSLLRSLIENVPGAIYRCALDSDWTMELMGDEIERISGYPTADFIRNACRSFASIIHPDDRAGVERDVGVAVAADRPFALEYRVVRADGELRWVLERGAKAVDGAGREWLDGVIFDITERRRAERQLREAEAEAARVAELEAARTRIIAAADGARRRIERDLHDGAQQRLVAATLQLAAAETSAKELAPDLAEPLREARTELEGGLAELRELARGIHPAVLSDRGLAPAVMALADRAPLPVEVSVGVAERLPAPVEAAAYFLVAEALTNVARYAEASRAEVEVVRSNGVVAVAVRDDGVGGAVPALGSGLSGLGDRVAALRGRLEIDSPPGRGTVVRAEIPCER